MENSAYSKEQAAGSLIVKLVVWLIVILILASCSSAEKEINASIDRIIIETAFGDALCLDNLYNYADQDIPNFIREDNTRSNSILKANAIRGRVLFYDKGQMVPGMNQEVFSAIVSIVKTLSGSLVYTDKKWSDPFKN